jgi:hypothetical protein
MNRVRSFLFSSRLAAFKKLGLAILYFVLFSENVSFANVYPTQVKLQGTTTSILAGEGDQIVVGFILNEPATLGTVVEIWSDTNLVRTLEVLSGDGTLRGSNTLVWDGKDELGQNAISGLYSVRVTAKTSGYADWTLISDDNAPGSYVYEPRGIAVNCNSNSPYYGRVFVGNAHANPGIISAPGDSVGILKLNADGSLAEEGEFSDGGYPWAGDFFSPWKIEVSEDDRVYINDWTGLSSAGVVIAFDQTISTNYQIVLDSSNWPAVGNDPTNGATNYANLSGPAITGSGTNTQIWMADISFNPDTNIARCQGIRRWNVTTNGSIATGDTGTTIVQAGGGSDLNLYPYDLTIDTNGNIYTIQNRANPADTAAKAFKFPAYDESGLPWTTNSIWHTGEPGNLLGAFGIAVNRAATLVAVALKDGRAVVVLDAETGTNVATMNIGLDDDHRDVAWDNVGNLYTVDNSASVWRAISPPGTNQATTVALQRLQIIQKPLLSSPICLEGQFQCVLGGETNFNYLIESSTNLANWSPISTNFLSNATQVISVDIDSNVNDRQFFRAVLAR